MIELRLDHDERDIVTWEPKIIAFCCNWCAYAGADLAGVTRLQYPPNVLILRVMCSGRVEPSMVLKCFENGADGVMVLGCHIGDCHYQIGNRKAEGRMADTKELLGLMGISNERLMLRWISASEGVLFAETVNQFVERIRVLGPLKGGVE